MSVSVAPYGDALYGGNNYGGVQVSSVGRFDEPSNQAVYISGSPSAATYDFNQPRRAS